MTESEYINATNLVKARAVLVILRDIHEDGEIVKTTEVACRQVYAWVRRLEDVVVCNDPEGDQEGRKP